MSPFWKFMILGAMFCTGVGILPAIGILIYMQMVDNAEAAKRAALAKNTKQW